MLSRTADYALRAFLVLGQAAESGRQVPADEIADAIGAPRNYMSKVLNAAVKAGFVRSARGPQGGFSLVRPAAQVSVADVIDAFDDTTPNRRCLLGNGVCDPLHPCDAHHRWTRVLHDRRAPLESTTLADLLHPTTSRVAS